MTVRRFRRVPSNASTRASAGPSQVPIIGQIFPAPEAAKVPEVILLFWLVKILTTAGGEATSDYLKTWGISAGGPRSASS